MAHSSPEGIELSKGSNLESFSLNINKEKVLELKQQERIYSEEEVWKLVNKLNQTLNIEFHDQINGCFSKNADDQS